MWTWEQPETSMMWQVPELIASIARTVSFEVIFDWCEWGHPWRKRTKVVGRLPILPELRRRCSGNHKHQILQGKIPGSSRNWTELAAEYSTPWCRAYAKLTHAMFA